MIPYQCLTKETGKTVVPNKDLGHERGCIFSHCTFLLFIQTGKPGVQNKINKELMVAD